MDMLDLCGRVGSCANFFGLCGWRGQLALRWKGLWHQRMSLPHLVPTFWSGFVGQSVVCFWGGGETGQLGVWWCMPALLAPHMLWNPYWTLWVWGGANFVYFGEAIKCGGTVLVGYSFLYFDSLIPPECFMSFSVCMSLFLSLDVGSLLRTL